MNFWNIDTEKKFFTEAMKNFASPEQLFYKLTDGYFAYIPKGKSAEGQITTVFAKEKDDVSKAEKFFKLAT